MLEKLPDAVGHALRHQRAGLEKLAYSKVDLRAGMAAIEVTSLAFADHAPIPPPYTADGRGLSPPLQWAGVPATAGSLVLIVEDADAPTPQPLVHAIAVELPPEDGSLPEGALQSSDDDAADLKIGRNSYLQSRWLPPDPPPGHGVHRYAFQIFALAPGARFSGTPGRDEVLEVLAEHAVASGCLIGTYERPDGSEKAGTGQPDTGLQGQVL
ncbi:YbhB/YbcL family Raf kinase inhibitor-like protein [Caldimonas brevitalea]|uniref:Phosphatidylethanolamine-binding protein n=1 Tax=Caldimonas brevitalea TaxID=413882 RepID=A0A0G3BYD0_9BURK|nr:YbhB/YbcL family Raf kinase inhibitor-like protein [Caldimonas brevitalea]AKJ31545.1 phosphatidylethanolamine-binding protein [Caldimonas brevitalea]